MIISILGTSGANIDRKKCMPTTLKDKAYYDVTLLNKESGFYANATQYLLQNYDDDNFVLVGTECALTFQKELLKEDLKGKNIKYKKISDTELDDVFEVIYTLLEESKEKIVLDITHGYRHQPIMAIFASSLSKFLNRNDLEIIFAKEVISYKKYQYIYLNDYIETTHISLLLSGFIRTLNFIPIANIKLIDVKTFENFSKSLLANDMLGVQDNYKKVSLELKNLLDNNDLKHIHKLVNKIENILKPLEKFDLEDTYINYLTLSKITLEKNYLVISLAYTFESIREYCSLRFEPLLGNISFKDDYTKNTAVMDTVSDWRRNGKENAIQKKYKGIVKANSNFNRVSSIYNELRVLRNDLAHINNTKKFGDIKQKIKSLIFKINSLYKDDALKFIKV